MSWISGAVGAALGTVGTIFANISADKTRKKLLELQGTDPTYNYNQNVAQRQGLAGTLLNARMPGAANSERNIANAGANNMANITRNATDSSQVLALGAANQGQTDQAYQNLQQQDAQDYYNRLGNFNSATEASAAEGHYKNQDDIRQWQDKVNILMARNALRQQQGQNMQNLGGQVASMGGMGGGKK